MATSTLPVVAGMVSTTVFAGSMLPMLLKAARTRDLSSYSIGNLVLANIGNAVHSVYVFHLPPGPIWFLHGFYLLTSALMLCWWVRYRPGTRRGGADGTPTGAAALGSAAAAAGAPETCGAPAVERTYADGPVLSRGSRTVAPERPAWGSGRVRPVHRSRRRGWPSGTTASDKVRPSARSQSWRAAQKTPIPSTAAPWQRQLPNRSTKATRG